MDEAIERAPRSASESHALLYTSASAMQGGCPRAWKRRRDVLFNRYATSRLSANRAHLAAKRLVRGPVGSHEKF
jgi:hypothetical protein